MTTAVTTGTTVVSTELFKLRTTRAPWVVAIALAALAAAVLAFSAALLGKPGQPALEPSVLGALARASGSWAGGAALLLGILLSSAEYRHGTVLTTRLAHPKVPGLVVGKATAAALAGLVLALGLELVMVGGGAVVLAAGGIAVEPSQHGIPAAVGSIALVTTLYAVAGVGIGELLRNSTLAVGAVFGIFVVEGVLPIALREPGLARWLPGGATSSTLTIGGAHNSALLMPWAGLLMLTAYTAVLLLAGVGRSKTTDP
jgi:ABC-2 type transport system permease protein